MAMPANGYTVLPPGKLVNAVTWLELRAPFPIKPARLRKDLSLHPLRGVDAARYMSIYRAIAHRWLWDSRLYFGQSALVALLDQSNTEAYALVCHGEDVGLLELAFADGGKAAEVAHFGLHEHSIGQGVGGWLMQQAMVRATLRGVPRLTVHTCHFDHPRALGFYRACGFIPYQTGYEIMDDPRLTGLLPRDAAPHVPLLA